HLQYTLIYCAGSYAHLLSSRQRCPICEHCQSSEHTLLSRSQQVVAPSNGSLQSLLALRNIRCLSLQDRQSFLKLCKQDVRGEVPCASCCQFNGERNTIQASTNSRDGSRVDRSQLKIWYNCLGPLQKERDRSIL